MINNIPLFPHNFLGHHFPIQIVKYSFLQRLFLFVFSVLFVSVVVFVATAAYVFSDSRSLLFPSIKLYQPSFLYAYTALLMQGGVVQVRE